MSDYLVTENTRLRAKVADLEAQLDAMRAYAGLLDISRHAQRADVLCQYVKARFANCREWLGPMRALILLEWAARPGALILHSSMEQAMEDYRARKGMREPVDERNVQKVHLSVIRHRLAAIGLDPSGLRTVWGEGIIMDAGLAATLNAIADGKAPTELGLAT